jgi:hypothetical protein
MTCSICFHCSACLTQSLPRLPASARIAPSFTSICRSRPLPAMSALKVTP